MLRRTTFVTLLAALFPVAVAALQTNVLLQGLDTNKPVSLVVGGVERPLGEVGSNGEISIPLDPAALDPNKLDPAKDYVVYKDSCSKYHIYILASKDEEDCKKRNEEAKSDDPCGRCVPVLLILKGKVALHPDAPSTPASTAPPGGGPAVDLFLLGGWNRTNFGNIDVADGTIAGRYNASGYNAFQTTIDRRDNGFGAGAGVRVMFGTFGVSLAYSFQDVGGGEVHTAGTRVLNSLDFSLDSEFSVDTHKVIVGLPIGNSRFLFVPYYGRAFWNVDRTIVDRLTAGGVQVRGGTTAYAADGSDQMFGARGEAYLHRFLGVFAEVERINFKNVFPADGPDALPADLDNTNINAGVVIRLPVRR